MKLIPLFILSFVFLSGCISDNRNYFEESVTRPVEIGLDPSTGCPIGECVCMACNVSIPDEPYSKFYKFSYASGDCAFIPCNQTQYISYLRPPSPNYPVFNYFMLGQGGFGEFNKANPYCNNSLRMPVKWLDSRYGLGTYPLPDAERAACFMEKGAMPVYVLYSRGENIDPGRAGEIASRFEGKGPVIITSEINFNSSDPSQLHDVQEQVITMKAECPDCLIALAPRLGDNSTGLDELMQDPLANESIDLFAFGLDSRDFPTCNPATVYYSGVEYSEHLLYKYKKPSVWVYMLFDRDLSKDGSCFWDEATVSSAYADFYNFAPGFASSGIIGASAYSLYNTGNAGPLNCTDCGLFTENMEPLVPEQPAWFTNCQEVYSTRSTIPLLFSNAPGTTCLFGPLSYVYTGITYYSPAEPQPAKSSPAFYACDSCLATKKPTPISVSVSTSLPDWVCSNFTILDTYADIRDLDPGIVRATAYVESGFDPCSTSTSSRAPCGREEALNSVTDPDGICTWDGRTSFTARSGSHVCAMGMMQTLAAPYTYLKETDAQYEPAVSCAPGGKYNPYNPEHSVCLGTYELQQGLEWGRGIVNGQGDKMGLAAIRADYGEEEYENAKGLLTAYMIRFYYIGSGVFHRSWIDQFQEYSTIDDSFCEDHADHVCCEGGNVRADYKNAGCCGNKYDFIRFVSEPTCFPVTGIDSMSEETRGYIKNARERFIPVYLGIHQKCGICNSEQWERNLDSWAASQG